MANTPEGTPYVESSDLVANYPAASLALANRVDLVGILPFANAAARTTAIPSPTDGQYSYLQDTNSTQYWDGAAWVPAGTPPGLVHIVNVSLSATSTISVNNCFTSTYQFYEIIFDFTTTNNAELRARLRAAGTDDTGSNYTYQYFFASGTGSGASRATTTYYPITTTNTTTRNAVSLTLMSPQVATATNLLTQSQYGASSAALEIYAQTHSQNTSYDGITIFTSAGTVTGTARIYGYSNG